MDRKYKFPATCPYCGEHTDWPLSIVDIGEQLGFVECDHCGKTYAIKIELIPNTIGVYALLEKGYKAGQ